MSQFEYARVNQYNSHQILSPNEEINEPHQWTIFDASQKVLA